MMMTHSFLEWAQKRVNPHLGDQLERIVGECVQIDCGDPLALPVAGWEAFRLVRSPFPSTLLQLAGRESDDFSHLLVFWRELDSEHFELLQAKKFRGPRGWSFAMPCRITKLENDDYRYANQKNDADWAESCSLLHAMLQNIFAVLACSNVTTIDHEPPQALNKKRIKNGKVPLFSYKTLAIVVDKSRAVGPSMGGTHASPRVHLRRGHIRHLADGRTLWVQACVVGSTHGIVHKDYRITTKAARESAIV